MDRITPSQFTSGHPTTLPLHLPLSLFFSCSTDRGPSDNQLSIQGETKRSKRDAERAKYDVYFD